MPTRTSISIATQLLSLFMISSFCRIQSICEGEVLLLATIQPVVLLLTYFIKWGNVLHSVAVSDVCTFLNSKNGKT